MQLADTFSFIRLVFLRSAYFLVATRQTGIFGGIHLVSNEHLKSWTIFYSQEETFQKTSLAAILHQLLSNGNDV